MCIIDPTNPSTSWVGLFPLFVHLQYSGTCKNVTNSAKPRSMVRFRKKTIFWGKITMLMLHSVCNTTSKQSNPGTHVQHIYPTWLPPRLWTLNYCTRGALQEVKLQGNWRCQTWKCSATNQTAAFEASEVRWKRLKTSVPQFCVSTGTVKLKQENVFPKL